MSLGKVEQLQWSSSLGCDWELNVGGLQAVYGHRALLAVNVDSVVLILAPYHLIWPVVSWLEGCTHTIMSYKHMGTQLQGWVSIRLTVLWVAWRSGSKLGHGVP